VAGRGTLQPAADATWRPEMNYRHFRVPTAVLVSVSPENETIAVKSQENTVATTAQGGDVVDS